MNSSVSKRLQGILQLISNEDWSDRAFSLKKACVCVELSAMVYEDVQEYELKGASRVHLFASQYFRAAVKSQRTNNLLAALGEGNDATVFVSRGRNAVVFGTQVGDVLILAVRGTKPLRLWDWKANIDKSRYNVTRLGGFCPFLHSLDDYTVDFDDQFFHRGFFESIVPQFHSIAQEIAKSGKQPKIVWTGHSLGGAMAAVGHAFSASGFARRSLASPLPGEVVGAYTFGMPRYCGLGAVCSFPAPFHIYRTSDIVPCLPTRGMGFADSPSEYELTEQGTISPTERTDVFDLAGHVPRLWSSLKAHFVEGYSDSLFQAAKLPRPGR